MKKNLLAFSCLLLSSLGFAQTTADALNFDGTNDCVPVPVSSSLPSFGLNDFTFEAWVYPKVNSSAYQMILAKDQWGSSNSELRLCMVNGIFRFSMSDVAHIYYLDLSSPGYVINNWYHVAAVRQGTTYALYVNGAVVSTTTTPVVLNSNNSLQWNIGYRPSSTITTPTDVLNGSIDEVRIWNVARTKCEINTYMNCEIPTSAPGLGANFHFNQGVATGSNSTVTTLTDASGNANNGTLSNFSLTGANSNWVSPGGVTAGSVTPLPPISVSVTSSSSLICSGSTVSITGSGAHTYSWSGGALTGLPLSPSVTTNYTVTGTNTITGCTNTAVTSVSVLPSPTITVNSGSLCSNYSYTITPSGASTYTYSGGSAIVSPTYNTTYTVSGTAPNGCVSKAVCSLTVLPSPTVTTLASQTAVCAGQAIQLNAIGASTYSWNGIASASNITVTPLTNTMYIVTGAAANLCETSKTLNIQVYALPNVSITPGRSVFCIGEKIILTGSGATSYTWTTQGMISPSIQVSPTSNTNYILAGSSSDNCVNSATFQLVVSSCTGIDKNQAGSDRVNIFPNPSNGAFSVRSETEMQIDIVNEIGQNITTLNLNEQNNYTVTLSELRAGIYFVLGSNGHSSVKEKVVVIQ